MQHAEAKVCLCVLQLSGLSVCIGEAIWNTVLNFVQDTFSSGTSPNNMLSLYSLTIGVRRTSGYYNQLGFEDPGEWPGENPDIFDGTNSNNYSIVAAAILFALQSIPDIYPAIPAGASLLFEVFRRSDDQSVYSDYPNNCYATLDSDWFYDGVTTYGIPVIVATSGNTSGTPGTGVASAYGSIRYHVSYNVPFSGPVSFFLDSQEATTDVIIDIY